MGKVLLYASIAVTLAATAIGFLNKDKLATAKDQIVSAEKKGEEMKAAADKSQKGLKEKEEEAKKLTAEKEQASAQVDSLKGEVEKLKSQVADAVAKGTEKDTKITEQDAKIKELEAKVAAQPAEAPAVAAVSKPEDLARIQELETLVTKLQGDQEGARERITKLEAEKTIRSQGKLRNGLEGKILAVNQAWNFVVLNLGDKNGVVGNAEMLIKRGTQLVGKVRITSVEPSTSIADIVAGSVPSGVNIQPGDNVIYQATAE
ncbi:MAG: hypothetical protein WCS65_16750 [Verrucomicrobiae bacterium]